MRSYALDAIEVADSAGDKSGNDDAQAILDQCGSAEIKRFEAIGEGEDLRLSSSKIEGAALVCPQEPTWRNCGGRSPGAF